MTLSSICACPRTHSSNRPPRKLVAPMCGKMGQRWVVGQTWASPLSSSPSCPCTRCFDRPPHELKASVCSQVGQHWEDGLCHTKDLTRQLPDRPPRDLHATAFRTQHFRHQIQAAVISAGAPACNWRETSRWSVGGQTRWGASRPACGVSSHPLPPHARCPRPVKLHTLAPNRCLPMLFGHPVAATANHLWQHARVKVLALCGKSSPAVT